MNVLHSIFIRPGLVTGPAASRIAPAVLLAAGLLAASCGGGVTETAATADADHDKESEAAGGPRVLHIEPDLQKEWGLETETPAPAQIRTTATLLGALAFDQNRTAQVSSFVAGKVVSVLTDLGRKVGRGQALAAVNAPEFAGAQSDYLQARAELGLAGKELDRARMLFREKAIEERELLRRQAAHEQAATRTGALESVLRSYGVTEERIRELGVLCDTSGGDEEALCRLAEPYLPLLSPISGTIVDRNVVLGEQVGPEKTLFVVTDLSELWADLDAYEKDLPGIRAGDTAAITASLFPGREFPGRIVVVGDVVDPRLRTVRVRAAVANPDGLLKPNMYVEARVESATGPPEDVLTLPEEAVQNLDGGKVVFVHGGEHEFVVTPVTTGRRTGGGHVAVQGLEPGDRVVVKGAFALKTELLKGTFGHGHVH